MVRQSYDVFNTFARDPASLTNLTMAFFSTLQGWDMKDIGDAFQRWMDDKSVMPTPADISKICAELVGEREAKVRRTLSEPPEWVQDIYDWSTDDLIESKASGNHLCPSEIDLQHVSRRTYVRMRKQT